MRLSLNFLVVLLFVSTCLLSQKKNGTIFIEHEAIDKTVNLWKAFENGDKETFLSYFADSVYILSNGKLSNWTKKSLGESLEWWNKEFENLKITDQKPAFPDALEYKEGGLWVQDWQLMTGRHIESGINLKLPVHRLYSFNKDGKITSLHSYYNNDIFEEIRNSKMTKENGTVYINHPYIITIRKAMNAFIDKDIDKWSSFYAPNASFIYSSMSPDQYLKLEENKDMLTKTFFTSGKEYKVEQIGYPDCIYYAKSDDYAVFSWWKMTIKKNDKKYEYVFMLTDSFDKEGKIISEYIYSSSNHIEGW
ncbi:hypothetical protein [Plebeiibacterium sediminum]|uniref:SnoaL-like domain-containing protein n=1 Tax=Plebeiibacterium sediminum TaxID=2992112 RepID=A0AAE3M445_9BACT|nr:hypothetical protein [Plebeiobacterium sediminum]MCW3786440.1 hypothetical protein [Plebeiobacterium sediminum]